MITDSMESGISTITATALLQHDSRATSAKPAAAAAASVIVTAARPESASAHTMLRAKIDQKLGTAVRGSKTSSHKNMASTGAKFSDEAFENNLCEAANIVVLPQPFKPQTTATAECDTSLVAREILNDLNHSTISSS